MRPIRLLLAAATIAASLAAVPVHAQVSLAPGDLIKTDAAPAVYYFGADGKRYVFPNDKTYFTWYTGFSTVKTISVDQMGGITIGGNVTYKPGKKLVKIQSDPKVYAISKNGILRAISSEAVAAGLYGSTWNKQVDDIPDAFFINYKVGSAIPAAAGFDKTLVASASPTINIDKLLVNPPTGFIDIRQTAGFVPGTTSVSQNTQVTWIAIDGSVPNVASNPHPGHTDVPGLFSGNLGMGETYTFNFQTAGTWGYHNHNLPNQTGTIVVQ